MIEKMIATEVIRKRYGNHYLRELARAMDVHENTVRYALKHLEEGTVPRRQLHPSKTEFVYKRLKSVLGIRADFTPPPFYNKNKLPKEIE